MFRVFNRCVLLLGMDSSGKTRLIESLSTVLEKIGVMDVKKAVGFFRLMKYNNNFVSFLISVCFARNIIFNFLLHGLSVLFMNNL